MGFAKICAQLSLGNAKLNSVLGDSEMATQIRAQYHFRKTESGLDAWDVRRLIELSSDLPIRKIDPASLEDIYKPHWYLEQDAVPSPASIVDHIRLVQECDLAYPIILDAEGSVMDGMHRVCKALLNDIKEIDAVQFTTDPDPDFTNCDPKSLPYND